MQHDWKHVERPGESHTALDGKKHEGVGRKKSVATLFWRQVDQHPNELTSTIGS